MHRFNSLAPGLLALHLSANRDDRIFPSRAHASVESRPRRDDRRARSDVSAAGQSVGEFTGNALKTSGANDPTEVLASADLSHPWGLIFDSKKNLWVSNVGNGTLTKFTFKQLKGLKNNDAPEAAVVIVVRRIPNEFTDKSAREHIAI